MLSESQLIEIVARIESTDQENETAESLRRDRLDLMTEVLRLRHSLQTFSAKVDVELKEIESSMLKLEAENDRLRSVNTSTYFERDACIGLLARLSSALGMAAGTCRSEVPEKTRDGSEELQIQNRVVIDLPSGQVSWDYLDEDAHLFANLPAYEQPLQIQSVQENYVKILNPAIIPS